MNSTKTRRLGKITLENEELSNMNYPRIGTNHRGEKHLMISPAARFVWNGFRHNPENTKFNITCGGSKPAKGKMQIKDEGRIKIIAT
jgi:hypothetical protein